MQNFTSADVWISHVWLRNYPRMSAQINHVILG